MNVNQRHDQRLEQNLLQGFDLQMMQNLYLLQGVYFSEYVEEYCRDNPALKLKSKISSSSDINFSLIAKEESLYSHLAFQIEVSFSNEEKEEALKIAASLDDNGFFTGATSSVLKKLQYLDPVGIAARDVKESLLIQLKDKDMGNSIAYKILDENYKSFLLGDIAKIAIHLKESKVKIENAIEEIRKLTPYPGRSFQDSNERYIRPEMILEFKDKWRLSFIKEYYPSVELIKNGSDKETLNAKRFIYQLHQRKMRLEWIVSKIVKRQENFLLGRGELNSLYRGDLLKHLDISESTLSRILSEKYIETPVGLFSLSHFFTRKVSNVSVDSSIEKAKKILHAIIEKENKKKPYADNVLRELLLNQGIVCSRRSVAKYRKALSIPGAYHRASK